VPRFRRVANPIDGRGVLVGFSLAKRRKVTSHYDGVEAHFVGLIKGCSLAELGTGRLGTARLYPQHADEFGEGVVDRISACDDIDATDRPTAGGVRVGNERLERPQAR
jgi:hypothetical protein